MATEVKLNSSGMAEIQRLFDALGERAARAIEDEAKSVVPVRTGALRDSIQAVRDGRDWTVGSDLPYASFVELGTAHTAPQPYLEPALIDVVENLDKLVEA